MFNILYKATRYVRHAGDGLSLNGVVWLSLAFKRRIKSRVPFAGIIRSSPFSTRFQDNG